jgi:hypothetical protein
MGTSQVNAEDRAIRLRGQKTIRNKPLFFDFLPLAGEVF